MQKDVVLVTFNYRLGPIGFLSLKDPTLGIPGNAGLKDQTFALKWVQKNIENFGGDPNQVTIFGESVSFKNQTTFDNLMNFLQAGGSCVHFHMLSNHSKNLFKRAIVMSGCAFDSWAYASSSDWGDKLAKKLGWSGGSDAELLEFLESCDSFEMIRAQTQLYTNEEMFGLHELFPFVPVVEPYESENCFIPKNPIEMARECWSKDVDCIIGATSFEGMINAFIEDHESFDEKKNFLNENIGYFAPVKELKIDPSSEKAKKYGKKIKELYLQDKEFTRENVEKYYHVS